VFSVNKKGEKAEGEKRKGSEQREHQTGFTGSTHQAGKQDQYDSPCRRPSRALQYLGGEQPKVNHLEKSVDKTDISRYTFPMIIRRHELETLRGLLKRHPVVGIVGARQVGKTTFAHALATHAGGPTSYFDLENTEDMARLVDHLMALQE